MIGHRRHRSRSGPLDIHGADPARHRPRARAGPVGVPADLLERSPAAGAVAVRLERLRRRVDGEGVRRRAAHRDARRRHRLLPPRPRDLRSGRLPPRPPPPRADDDRRTGRLAAAAVHGAGGRGRGCARGHHRREPRDAGDHRRVPHPRWAAARCRRPDHRAAQDRGVSAPATPSPSARPKRWRSTRAPLARASRSRPAASCASIATPPRASAS